MCVEALLQLSRRWLAGLVVVGVFAAGLRAEPAQAAPLGVWWGVNSAARPTNVGAGSGRDEVQRLTVSATKGDYLVVNFSPFTVAIVSYNASASEVQAAFEEIFPTRAVVVSEEPSSEEDTRMYTVRFPGEAVEPAFVTPDTEEFAGIFGGEALSGGKNEAFLVRSQEGEATRNEVAVEAVNLGDVASSGVVKVGDALPKGVRPVMISGRALRGTGVPLSCSLKPLQCVDAESVPAFEELEVQVAVVVEGGQGAVVNTAVVSGGGAVRAVSVPHTLDVGGPERFGFDEYRLVPEAAGGGVDTQAGSHPFQLTSLLTFNTGVPYKDGSPRSVELPKDVVSELPAGLVGDPIPFAQCTDAQFSAETAAPGLNFAINGCPVSSAVGAATVTYNLPLLLGHAVNNITVPIFNMVPRRGEPVRFGFKVEGVVSSFLDTSVRTGGDYGVSITASNITQISDVLSVKLMVWGVPGDPAHDGQRGWACLENTGGCQPGEDSASPPPFLVLPTSCEAPFVSSVGGDSWGAFGHPSQTAVPVSYTLPERIDGCNHLPFNPEVKVTADGEAASTPTGLNVDVHVPQEAVLHAESLAESGVRDIMVALPEGVAVNPAGGDGLLACSESQAGFTGFGEVPVGSGASTALFTPGVVSCPDAAKIGTVTIKLPILAHPVEGAVYLAAQNENPFGALIGVYLVAEDPVSGVLVKLAGETRLTALGQLVGVFRESPQAPFEDAELHFFGGERAPLATPAHCGAYTTSASFVPWSGNAAVSSSSTFNISRGPNGAACPGASLPFAPTLVSDMTDVQAGGFSSLVTTIGRGDGEQDLGSVVLHMPPGLSGILAGVRLCPEAQANQGTCGPESLVGETTISAGLGGDPVTVKGGRVYLTEHYAGAPFGLSIVNPVKAGPFDLEHDTSKAGQQPACDCVVVRAKIDVDPNTAALTITANPPGSPFSIPRMIDGIPVQIKHVNVTINRPGFTFNPTTCNPLPLTGTIMSQEGAAQTLPVHFQVTNCAILAFHPSFKVSTSGRTSRANGASLTVKLTYPNAPFGSQTNIAKVKVDLPRQLPSRLTTLQKACAQAVFEANPANCPRASIVGHAKVITPLLPVPLEGPAYFVSHGGEAFPSLTIVLQGYGVTIDLTGSTFIRKGITSTTFKSTPDVPFNAFELTLPQGPYSALAANGNLCTTKLTMPTSFTAQNGTQTHQTTKITTTNCKHKKHRQHNKK